MSRYTVGFISMFSGIFIIAAITSMGYIYNDINNFYSDAMEDLKEFKVFADEAWTKMLSANNKQTRLRRQVYYKSDISQTDISNSVSITKYGACNCSKKEDNCLQGPPGAQGFHGEPGFDGENGKPGRNGYSDASCYNGYDTSRCILCLPGRAGPPGLKGPRGPAGASGRIGAPGRAGQNGASGEKACRGYAGQSGKPGNVGRPGPPGQNGQRGKGSLGPPGKPGSQGLPGGLGATGEVGVAGADGESGLQGNTGNPGKDGQNGDGGLIYGVSKYCPCPPRATAITHDNVLQKEDKDLNIGYRRVRFK